MPVSYDRRLLCTRKTSNIFVDFLAWTFDYQRSRWGTIDGGVNVADKSSASSLTPQIVAFKDTAHCFQGVKSKLSWHLPIWIG